MPNLINLIGFKNIGFIGIFLFVSGLFTYQKITINSLNTQIDTKNNLIVEKEQNIKNLDLELRKSVEMANNNALEFENYKNMKDKEVETIKKFYLEKQQKTTKLNQELKENLNAKVDINGNNSEFNNWLRQTATNANDTGENKNSKTTNTR